MCLGVNQIANTEKEYLKEIGLHAQNMQTILSSIVKIVGGGGAIWPLHELENLHIDNE